MGLPRDYGDEMDRVDPRPIDAALSGRETGEPALDRAARVVADLRRVLLEEPSPEAATGHLEAMVSAASDGARGSTPVLSERRRRRRFASLPLAAVLLLGAGLAWGAAGLPEQASDTAEDAVAAAQARGGSTPVASPTGDGVTHGDEVSAVARDDSLQGCEKGRAVSEVAGSKGKAQGPAQDPCARGDEGQSNAEKASAKGKQRSAEAKAEARTEATTKGETGAASGGGRGGGPPDSAEPPESAGPPADPGSQGIGGGKP